MKTLAVSPAPAAASPRTAGARPSHAPPDVRRPAARWQLLLAGLALFGLALVPRLTGLEQHLTADDQDWVARIGRFGLAVQRGNLRETYQSGHPGVVVLWIASLAVGLERSAELAARAGSLPLLEKSPRFLGAVFDARRALAAVSAGLTVVLAGLTWRLFGPGPGLLAGLLLANEPFLVAHGRLIYADPLESQLMAASVLAALIFFHRRGGRAYLVGSGLAAGLALLAKAPAIFLFGFIPLLGLARTRGRARGLGPAELRRLARQLVPWALAAGAVYLLLWPALWVDPLGTLNRMIRDVQTEGEAPRTWGDFFLGQPVKGLGPLFYPLVTVLRLSPITLAGLLVLAVVLVSGRGRMAWRPLAAGLLAYPVLFTLMMTPEPKKADRYLMPVYPILVILGGLGLYCLLRRWLPPAPRWAAGLALGLGQAALVAGVQPYPLSFYDPLLGGIGLARQVVEIGWGEGLDQVAAYLDSQPNASEIVTASLNEGAMNAQFRGKGGPIWEWQRADYLVDYVNMDQRGIIPVPLQRLVRDEAPVFTARVNGLDYARVYPIPAELKARGESADTPRKSSVPRP